MITPLTPSVVQVGHILKQLRMQRRQIDEHGLNSAIRYHRSTAGLVVSNSVNEYFHLSFKRIYKFGKIWRCASRIQRIVKLALNKQKCFLKASDIIFGINLYMDGVVQGGPKKLLKFRTI